MQLQSGLSGLQLWNIEWLDLLTAYDGYSISYDAIGNPTNWYNTKAWNFTWQNGRQLATAKSGSTTISYTYDVAGIRDSKTVGSTVYSYLTQNGKVVRQTWGNHTLDIIYDNQGNPSCCIYDKTKYNYVLNLQGDVIRLVNTTGSTAASYVYDAWGNVISSSGTMAEINPIRYRGYYYDTETKLYYLGSRYYDPAVKRFINADGYASTGQGFIGCNMFAYCNNNPVALKDSDGTVPDAALTFFNFLFYGALSAADGPLPIFDIAASIIFIYSVSTSISDATANSQIASDDLAKNSTTVVSAPIATTQTDVAAKQRKQYSYWAAMLVNGEVVIGRGLSFSEACSRVASLQDIMCRDYSAAKALVIVNNYRHAIGPERHKIKGSRNTGSRWGYWHFHANSNHGSKKAPKVGVHIWYYGGKYG